MDLVFFKLRVGEADLLLVDDLDATGRARDWAAAARALLDRRTGVGAQRLVVLARADKDIWLRVLDAEGGKDVALFDAALCAARWLLDSGKLGADAARFRWGGGALAVDVLDGSNLGIDLGPPLCLPGRGRLTRELAEERRSLIEVEGERFEALPAGLGRLGPRAGAGEESGPEGPGAVAIFFEGASKPARIGGGGARNRPPEALPVRIVSGGELRLGASRDPRLDAVSRAGIALATAALLGRADHEALVGFRSGLLWAELARSGSVYVAARPEYVFRGEFHLDEGPENGAGAVGP